MILGPSNKTCLSMQGLFLPPGQKKTELDGRIAPGALVMALNAAAYGIYPHDAVLSDIVHNLNQAGFGNEDICMMLAPSHPIASMVRDASFNTEKQASATTAGLIGWLSEFGAVVIPTVGFFIRSQAYFHALVVSREAASLCGNTRTLVGLGFSEEDAERFEEQLGVFVYVSCQEGAKTQWAREVLRHTGAQEAATLAEPIAMAATA